MARGAVRTAEHDGLHASALERAPHARTADADRGSCGRGVPRADEHLADGRTDSAVLHDGRGRSRRADRHRGPDERRPDRIERVLTARHRRRVRRRLLRAPVPPRRRAEDRVRRPGLCHIPRSAAAGGGPLAAVAGIETVIRAGSYQWPRCTTRDAGFLPTFFRDGDGRSVGALWPIATVPTAVYSSGMPNAFRNAA